MMVGTGMGWGFGFGWLAMALFWVFVVAGIVWLVLALGRSQQSAGASEHGRAAAILAERYARGEIDGAEYTARKGALEEGSR